jgi:hypothetical protein
MLPSFPLATSRTSTRRSTRPHRSTGALASSPTWKRELLRHPSGDSPHTKRETLLCLLFASGCPISGKCKVHSQFPDTPAAVFTCREDAAAAMDNVNNAELYGRVLTVNLAQPIKIKGGEQGWANQPGRACTSNTAPCFAACPARC